MRPRTQERYMRVREKLTQQTPGETRFGYVPEMANVVIGAVGLLIAVGLAMPSGGATILYTVLLGLAGGAAEGTRLYKQYSDRQETEEILEKSQSDLLRNQHRQSRASKAREQLALRVRRADRLTGATKLEAYENAVSEYQFAIDSISIDQHLYDNYFSEGIHSSGGIYGGYDYVPPPTSGGGSGGYIGGPDHLLQLVA